MWPCPRSSEVKGSGEGENEMLIVESWPRSESLLTASSARANQSIRTCTFRYRTARSCARRGRRLDRLDQFSDDVAVLLSSVASISGILTRTRPPRAHSTATRSFVLDQTRKFAPPPPPPLGTLSRQSLVTMGAGQSQILEDMEKTTNCQWLSAPSLPRSSASSLTRSRTLDPLARYFPNLRSSRDQSRPPRSSD